MKNLSFWVSVIAFLFINSSFLKAFEKEEEAIIKKILITVEDVFDLSAKEENHFIGKWANLLHIETKKSFIKSLLLFKEGDRLDIKKIYESERNLRELGFFREVEIKPLIDEKGDLVVNVLIKDAWSIKGGLKFSSINGESSIGVRLHEVNLLGYGKTLLFSLERNPERNISEFEYFDPLFWGSRYQFKTIYKKYSDGFYKEFTFEYPFYELKTKKSYGIDYSSEKMNYKIYDGSELKVEIPFKEEKLCLYFIKKEYEKEYRVLRAGLEWWLLKRELQKPFYLIPWKKIGSFQEKYNGVVFTLNYLEDKFQKVRNLSTIGFDEDFNRGYEFYFHFGYFPKELNSLNNCFYFDMKLDKGFVVKKNFVFFELIGEGRRESSRYKNLFIESIISTYTLFGNSIKLVNHIEIFKGKGLDITYLKYIGATHGLRGYPNYFKLGDSRFLYSLDLRRDTEKTILGILQIGYTLFFDMGKIREWKNKKWSKEYMNLGFGLRCGNLKSAFGKTIMVTISFPLRRDKNVDKYQILIGNFIKF